jgi:hypothetical protein
VIDFPYKAAKHKNVVTVAGSCFGIGNSEELRMPGMEQAVIFL